MSSEEQTDERTHHTTDLTEELVPKPEKVTADWYTRMAEAEERRGTAQRILGEALSRRLDLSREIGHVVGAVGDHRALALAILEEEMAFAHAAFLRARAEHEELRDAEFAQLRARVAELEGQR